MREDKRQDLQRQVAIFNLAYPIGTPVHRFKLMDPLREGEETETISQAWVLENHTPVILVACISGCVHLDSVIPPGVDMPPDPSTLPRPLTRAQQMYQDFLDFDGGMRFGEYLKWRAARKKRERAGV